MAETPISSLLRRQSTQRKKVKFTRIYEPHLHQQAIVDDVNELINDRIPENDVPRTSSRISVHWKSNREDKMTVKHQINTDTEQFDALFARSNASSPPSPHPRCYSSTTPVTIPFQIFTDTSLHNYAKSQPHLTSSPSRSIKLIDVVRRQSNASSTKSQQSNVTVSPNSAQTKRKKFFLTHAAQVFLQSSNSQSEQLGPLARSCSYKRPQSIKKYRQQKKGKEKEQKEQKEYSSSSSPRKYSTYNNNILHTVTSDSTRKSVSSGVPSRISATDLMATVDPHDQWSSPKALRSGRVGSLPLDQLLQLPHDGDEEIYRVRQFHTTSKGFVNRGDSFKRSFKRSGSTSRRSSFRKSDRTPSQEHVNESIQLNNEMRTSSNSLTVSNITPAGPNLNGILDNNFIDSTIENISTSPAIDDENDEDDDDNLLVDRIETEDGRVQDIRVYQVYLLGMSGTGKCSLLRQFKTTEYRGIYEYSSSVEDDPDNTVSIMLDGIESRLHIINIDVDLKITGVGGDACVVVYSITDRQSFQTAIQLIKHIREKELTDNISTIKRSIPIILVGNKSDLVRKRAVTKETARHAAFRYDCKFVETSAAINDKVDDLLAGTLKQIRINEQKRFEQRRRLTVTNGAIDITDINADKLSDSAIRKNSTVYNRNSKNVFSKFLNVFRKKPSRLPADVENLNTDIR
ncbi:unnamed protein product [Adineta steineri]|uniref:Uncharacterized protein n=1 Tax=Adineta steineri TaxID=433720 RepID=A0A815PPB2_9BILA|nr:unnamed protein product [Adineta steineri]